MIIDEILKHEYRNGYKFSNMTEDDESMIFIIYKDEDVKIITYDKKYKRINIIKTDDDTLFEYINKKENIISVN